MIIRRFRAGEPEQEIPTISDLPGRVGDDELVWVDGLRSDEELGAAIRGLGLVDAADRLSRPSERPELLRQDEIVIVSAVGLKDGVESPEPVTIDIAALGNVVLTVRDGSVAGLDDSLRVVRGRTRLGMLDAATFVAVLLDGIVSGYFASTEEVERQIDRIDDVALRSTPDERVLDRLLIVRRRVAALRRSLVPHRPVIAALARPDLGLRSGEDDPWPALVERVERAIETIENARELLVGSFEIVMTRTGQRTNDIMRTLTVVSVTLLPASLIAAIFGMNFRAELFDVDGLFWPMVGAIGALCGAILLTARLRGWL